ncbi:MAG: phosphatidate cytidylyltransferase [Ardenticatenaceae bacterium]|nr:phosphatidate cytidylyltransferase [Anaerolineales bacterium]MCB8941509.1 phosphatidate cytidylyltransferase [Ardenticatenaceae bacterium]MCB8974597.1 phosphatidate cytidylyltransferase [Ardenticatenaceae bacterium]
MFLQRALITFTLGPIALYLIYLGGWFYFVPLVIILLLATLEYGHIAQKIGWHVPPAILVPLVAIQWILAQWPNEELFNPLLLISLFIITAYALWQYETSGQSKVSMHWFATFAGLILFGWICGHFFRLRGLPEMAWQWTMLAMLSTWIADSGAYVVGRFVAGRGVIGKHPLSPRLSPNKTVEGFIGGIVLGTSFTVLIGLWLNIEPFQSLLLGLLVSILGTVGDLAISLLKREASVKDSGNLFPGHGGALDRIDSLMWTVAIAYYLAHIFL